MTSTVSPGACQTCVFRKPDARPEYADHGYCVRYPPTVLAWSSRSKYDQPEGVIEQHWPWMQPNDWCGEYMEQSK